MQTFNLENYVFFTKQNEKNANTLHTEQILMSILSIWVLKAIANC